MKAQMLSKYFGYTVSFVSLCVGTILLSGLFIRFTLPGQLRVMCGIVFLLMGVYRFVATRYKVREGEGLDQ
jgi:hypothetical protein